MTVTILRSVEAQCGSKRTYSHKGAKRAARGVMTKGGGRVVAYRCPHCDRYHVGHPPK